MYCQKCGTKYAKQTKTCPDCGFEPLGNRLRLKNIWRVSLVRGQNPVNGFPTDCAVCESCMNICSYVHEGAALPSLSRIIIDPTEIDWVLHETELSTVKRTVCQQCPGVAPCMAACTVPGAMSRDAKTGAVLIDEKICTRCRACEKMCPYGAVRFSETTNQMIKCDLCGGTPQCVEICPVGVLRFEKVT
jgi:Fe-S-cluster-containing dehydrogenase component/ribosomal protein L37E